MVMGTEPTINIGDYIQALAAGQFFDRVDAFVERERLDEWPGGPVKMIMNGWYMHHPEHWPPSPKIRPLFVSFHLNSAAADGMLTEAGIRYLRRHAPIGCRDSATVERLRAAGVEAWFSGCLTLTLGRSFAVGESERGRTCCFVDPLFTVRSREVGRMKKIGALCRNAVFLAGHAGMVRSVAGRLYGRRPNFEEWLHATTFCREYGRMFGRRMLLEAEYIRHSGPNAGESDEQLLARARELVEKYARAAMVVTSRIHCALPCLGLGTRVVLIENSRQEESDDCRFGGLRELFHVVEWDGRRLRKRFEHRGKLTPATCPPNKPLWEVYARELIARCEAFAAEEPGV